MEHGPATSVPFQGTANRVFAPPRENFHIALFCLVFFVFMAVTFVWAALTNIDGSFARPVAAAVMFGCFWSGWALLSICLLVAYWRIRVYATRDGVRVTGLLRNRALLFQDVSRAVWQDRGGAGGLVLDYAAGRVVIDFASYANGGELAAFFRQALPVNVQQQVERFAAIEAMDALCQAFQRAQNGERRPSRIFWVVGAGLIILAMWDPWGDGRRWNSGMFGAAAVLYGIWELITQRRSSSPSPAGERADRE